MRSAVDLRVCFIDAGSGALLLEYSGLKDQLAPGAPLAGRVEAIDFSGDASRTAVEIGGGTFRTRRRPAMPRPLPTTRSAPPGRAIQRYTPVLRAARGALRAR